MVLIRVFAACSLLGGGFATLCLPLPAQGPCLVSARPIHISDARVRQAYPHL